MWQCSLSQFLQREEASALIIMVLTNRIHYFDRNNQNKKVMDERDFPYDKNLDQPSEKSGLSLSFKSVACLLFREKRSGTVFEFYY